MCVVRWSHVFLALLFTAFTLLLGPYKKYEIIFIPLGPTLWPYSNLIVFQSLFISIDDEQSNTLLLSTISNSIACL